MHYNTLTNYISHGDSNHRNFIKSSEKTMFNGSEFNPFKKKKTNLATKIQYEIHFENPLLIFNNIHKLFV